MSYLDTMYEGLFKEAAPWGNSFGNTFANQDNGSAPDKQPEPPKPAPRAVPAAEQENPGLFQPRNDVDAPIGGTGNESAIDPYAGMPQTQEDWNRNKQDNPELWNQPGELIIGNDAIGGTGDEVATPFGLANATVPAKEEEFQPSQPYMPAPNSQDEADMQAKADAITIQSQLGALNPEEDAARIGIDPLYLQNILNRNNLTPEQKLEAYRRYVSNAENKAITVNETMPAAIASNSLTQAEVNDNTFKQTTGRDASLSEFINTYGADADLPSRFKPAMIPGTDSMVRNDLMNISTEETLQVLDDLKDNPAGIDKALEAIGSCRGIDPAFIRSEQFQSLTPDQQATYALAAVERSVMTGTDLGDKINGFLSKGDTKTNVFDTYMKTQNGKQQVKAMIDALPPQAMSIVCEKLALTGESTLSPETESFLKDAVKTRCWDALSDNFFGNLPSVVGLWFKSMGWQQMGGLAENPWLFYGGLVTLLLGGGALLTGGLFGGGDSSPTVVVQQSPQDSYRQNLYKTF